MKKIIIWNKNLIEILKQKKLNEYLFDEVYSLKFNFTQFLDLQYECNYLSNLLLSWRLLKQFCKVGNFLGIGMLSYYQSDVSRWTRSLQKNLFALKTLSKWDSRYYYGLCIAKKNNFLLTTLILWNVFYNEVIEKRLYLFSDRNEIIHKLDSTNLWQIIFKKRKKLLFKKNFFFLWFKPRAYSKIRFKLI